jgi:hypothetical protein
VYLAGGIGGPVAEVEGLAIGIGLLCLLVGPFLLPEQQYALLEFCLVVQEKSP